MADLATIIADGQQIATDIQNHAGFVKIAQDILKLVNDVASSAGVSVPSQAHAAIAHVTSSAALESWTNGLCSDLAASGHPILQGLGQLILTWLPVILKLIGTGAGVPTP